MAPELLLIKFLAVAVTAFYLVILIDVVIRDDFAFVEFSVGKTFLYDCTNREHSSGLWSEGAVLSGCWWSGHPLNSGRGHPLSMLGGGA